VLHLLALSDGALVQDLEAHRPRCAPCASCQANRQTGPCRQRGGAGVKSSFLLHLRVPCSTSCR
jgi:hypothetical protein